MRPGAMVGEVKDLRKYHVQIGKKRSTKPHTRTAVRAKPRASLRALGTHRTIVRAAEQRQRSRATRIWFYQSAYGANLQSVTPVGFAAKVVSASNSRRVASSDFSPAFQG